MKRTRAHVLIFLAAGALLGYLAASSRFLTGPEAIAAPGGEAQETKQPGEVILFLVRVPADAVLEIDDYKTNSTGAVRTFQTPPLPADGHYSYTLKATSQGKEVSRKIDIAHGVDNSFDLRAGFKPAAKRKTDSRQITTVGYGPARSSTPGSGSGAGQAERSKGDSKDEAAIAANGEAFVAAFHKGDAKALAAFWTPDGAYTDQTGIYLKGREAIEKNFKEFFSKYKGLKIQIDSQQLHFVSPEVAIEEGITEVFGADGGPPSRARFSNTHVKHKGQWLLGSVRDSAYIPPSNYEHLRGLEWAIGEWAGQADQGEVEHCALAWSDNRNFIVGHSSTSFKTALLGSAQQWICWDPLAKHLRSFVFDDSGAFGEGAWTNEGDKWTLKVALVLQDGKKATATYHFTRVDANTLAFQAIDRSVDGKALPDTKELKMKRVQ
jgi:uncharacterized protein (TIGR02246 family)